MRSKDIQRGITPRHLRGEGGGANIGRVAKLRDVDFFPGDRRSRRRGDLGRSMDPARRRAILIWSSVLSLGTLAVIGVTVFYWLIPHLASNAGQSPAILSDLEADVRVASKFPSPSRELTLDMVKRALANRDPEKVESLFRTGAASRAEILDFFNNSDARDGLVERYDWLSSVDSNGMLMEGVLVIYKGKEKRVERLALLTPDPLGNWKLDFEGFARTVRPSWKELLEKGANQAVVRVFVAKDDYYNGPFSDDKQWTGFAIASPDIDDHLRGYCKVGSAEAATLGKLFPDEKKLARATLEIRRVKDGEPNQFEITRVLAEDWVVADSAGGAN